MSLLNEKNIVEANDRLIARFGLPKVRVKKSDPTSAIILGILSQNTNDKNRDTAFHRLIEKYTDWNKLMKAPLQEIEETIEPAGMMKQRAKRIINVLKSIYEEMGDYNAGFLLKVPHEKAFEWLVSQDGIGEKTAAVFLLFLRNAPYFPVDTHIKRILPRLGWFAEKTSAIVMQREMTKICPPKLMKPFHLNLLVLGRTTCKSKNPRCEECPLNELCDYFIRSK